MWVVHGQKKPKMAFISEYLAADSSPDMSADAQCIINIGKFARAFRVNSLQYSIFAFSKNIFYEYRPIHIRSGI